MTTRRTPRNAPSRATHARIAAHRIVETVRLNGVSVREASKRVMGPKVAITPEDRSFALLLATGVISTWGSLERLLNDVLKSPEDVKPEVRSALYVPMYEILYLNKERHAACDQGVELVRSIAPRAAGVANFALRRICEAAKTFPRTVDLGESGADAKRAALASGFPSWLVARIINDRGREWAQAFLEHSGELSVPKHPAPVWFTFNPNRVDAPAALKSLVGRGVEAAPEMLLDHVYPAPVFRLRNRNAVADELFSALLAEGAIVVSDLSSQSIASLALGDVKPVRMLEVGAGRGTKTLLLQSFAKERFGSTINLHCIEVDSPKGKALVERTQRAKVPANVHVMDGRDLSSLDEPSFDRIFIDAPCTGLGTLRRHPEIKWRVKAVDVRHVAELNLQLLKQAAGKVGEHGVITYATCSVLREEDEAVVESFLASPEGADFKLVPAGVNGENYLLTMPVTGGPDIHFAAQFVRR